MSIGQPIHLRRLNARAICQRLLAHGPASRADLAKVLGLSAVTTGKVVDDLLAQGILQIAPADKEAPRKTNELGRPGQQVFLARTPPRFITLQLGVRHTRLAALPAAGPLAGEGWLIQFPTPADGPAWLKALQAHADNLQVTDPIALMLSVPGVVDEPAGRVLLSPNLHWLEAADLPRMLQEVTWGTPSPPAPGRQNAASPAPPVHLVQEIRALALGQLAAEPAEGDFLLVDFGQGMGGAVVAGGRLMAGPLPLSGELGHTPVLGNHRKCGCGATGCIETLAARPGLLASFAQAHPQQERSWPRLVEWVQVNGVEPWLRQTLEQVGVVVVGALNVVGVRRVIVTGALAELGSQVLEVLSQTVKRSAMWGRFGAVECVSAPRRRALGLATAALDRVVAPE